MRDRNSKIELADIDRLDWQKGDGLIPAVIQDADTMQVLMLGFMSREALAATYASGVATFFSRSRNRLWEKGETSGNRLQLRSIHVDCDLDALLVRVIPTGPTCHLGTPSCFEMDGASGLGTIGLLTRIVASRRSADPQQSYTAHLLEQGPLKIAQKVGEEGVELALAGAAQDKDHCIAEAADLLYHLIVLMEARGIAWAEIGHVLQERHAPKQTTVQPQT